MVDVGDLAKYAGIGVGVVGAAFVLTYCAERTGDFLGTNAAKFYILIRDKYRSHRTGGDTDGPESLDDHVNPS